MKMHCKRFGNEGNYITTASELKAALESYGGVINTKVYVAEITFSAQTIKKCSIPNINTFNNFSFETDGIKMWQAYNIGDGVEITYKNLNKMSNGKQNDTSLRILEMPKVTRQGMSRITIGQKKRKHSALDSEQVHSTELDIEDQDMPEEMHDKLDNKLDPNRELLTQEKDDYTCRECGLTFVSLQQYNIHQDIGNHKMKPTDHLKLLWSSKCTNIKETITKVKAKCSLQDETSILNTGWALKGKRANERLSPAVKDFVQGLFEEGEKTGRKYTPTEASKKIRSVRDESGKRIFTPDDWLSSQQIQGLFSRFLYSRTCKSVQEENGEDLNDIINEIARHETEMDLVHSICQ